MIEGTKTQNKGSYSLSYTFTPDDTNTYNAKTGTANYHVVAKELSQADITVSQEEKVYNGQAQSFESVDVKLGGKTLVKDTDYSVSYENNVNAGTLTATLIIEGKNNYTGKVEKTFSIQKKELMVANVTAKDRSYDGTNEVELIEVKLNGIAGDDKVNVDLEKACGLLEAKDAGEYGGITAEGFVLAGNDVGNYKLSETVNGTEFYLDTDVNISKKTVTIQNVTVKDEKEYDGNVYAEITDTGNISAICGNDDVSIVEGTAVYSDKNCGEDKVVTFAGFALAGKDAKNYHLQAQPENTTADIIQKQLETNVIVADKQYNGEKRETEVLFAEVLNAVSGDQVALNILNAEAVFTEVGDANVEMIVPVSVKGIEIVGNNAENYSLAQPLEVEAKILNNYIAEANIDYCVNSNDWINTDFIITAEEGKQISKLVDGTYEESLTASVVDENGLGTLEFYVKDANGDISRKVSEYYKIDKDKPTGTIKIENNEWKSFLNKVSLGVFFNNYYDVTIEAADQETLSGIKSIEYYEHKTTDTEDIDIDLSAVSWTEGDSIAVNWEEANTYVYYAKITDNAGNVTYVCSEKGIEYDKTLPVIEGVTDKQTAYTTKVVTVSDKNLESVTVNGEPVESTFQLEGDVKETYTIVATDRAGNVSTVVVKMKTIDSLKEKIENLTKDNVEIKDEDKIREIQQILENEDLTNATEEEKEQIEQLADKCERLQKVIEAKKEAQRKGAVETGDGANLYLWLMLLVMSVVVLRRKRA